MLEEVASSIYFRDVILSVKAPGPFGWLYDVLLSLFHDKIVSAINKDVAHALRSDVPKALNAYLSEVPAQVLY